MISPDEAVEIARRATIGKATLQDRAPVRVERRRGRYVVTFVHEQPPGVRGADYDAQVTIDAEGGEVIEILGGP
jgi:hypothetical protein